MSGGGYKPEKLLMSREWTRVLKLSLSPLHQEVENYLEEKGVDYAVEGPKGWGWATNCMAGIADHVTVELEDISPKMLKEVILPELQKIAKKHKLNMDWDGDSQEDYYIISINETPFGGKSHESK